MGVAVAGAKARSHAPRTATRSPAAARRGSKTSLVSAWPCDVFLIALAVYLRTLYPSVAGGDAGELITVAHRLQVAHPPGYPLFTLLGHLFTWIPFESIAWRVNLFSAVCDAATAALLCSLGYQLTGSRKAAAVAALAFAFAPLTWAYAITAEVFALNNLLAAALLFSTLRCLESPSPTRFAWSAFLFGLALSNHQTILFVGVPLLVGVLVYHREQLLSPRTICAAFLSGLVGLLPYAWLVVAASSATTLSWGDTGTVTGFVDHLLRRDYGTLQLGADGGVVSSDAFFSGLSAYGLSLGRNLLWVGVLPAIAGWVLLLRATHDRGSHETPSPANRPFAVLTAIALAVYLVTFHSMANLSLESPLLLEVTARFWQLPHLIVFVWLSAGIAFAFRAIPEDQSWIGALVAVALVATQFASNFGGRDESSNRFVEQYGHVLLADLPEQALLLVHGDLVSNAIRYLHTEEGVRSDVIVLDQELMTKPWYVERAKIQFPNVMFPGDLYYPPEIAPDGTANSFSIRQFLDANRQRFSIHAYPGLKSGDKSWQTTYETVPGGATLRILPRRPPDESAPLAAPNPATQLAPLHESVGLDRLLATEKPNPRRYSEGTWEYVVLTDYRQIVHARGLWLLGSAASASAASAGVPSTGDGANGAPPTGAEAEVLRRALDTLDAAAGLWGDDPPWYVQKNRGLAAMRLAAWDDSADTRAIAAWQAYLATAPATEKDREAILKWVGAHQTGR